jgi:exodeoxyribonuclease V beta subunit
MLKLKIHIRACLDFQSGIKTDGAALILQKLHEKQNELNLEQMSLDDVIRLINNKLADETSAAALRRIILQTYPVCLVDEFQDTDPEQFTMFNEIYRDSGSDTGFFMIGDPKQSIYAFRGADIFSYLNVRKTVQASGQEHDPTIFSLDTNWRSKATLVEATNRLFSEKSSNSLVEIDDRPAAKDSPVFIFEGIEYQAVNSCENLEFPDGEDEINKGQLRVGEASGLSNKPLVFIGNQGTGKELGKGRLLSTYAADTAARISALLDGHNGGTITGPDGVTKPVKPGQVAVLVRDKFEAKKIRDALAKPEIGIRCVYLSQKESVFSDAEIAEDIYHILVAINENNTKRSLKNALATPLMRGFGYDFKDLDRIETNENELEFLIEEFGAYKQQWAEYGVLTALGKLMESRGLYTAIAAREDSDRIITDFRHLGDILQQRDMETATAEQLIDWYSAQLDDDSALDEDSKRIRLESDENLVKIVTIHVSKGLEYPIVFLPFFYLARKVTPGKYLPLYHDEKADLKAIVDFEGEPADVVQKMTKERLAEDVRMLYVALTRAIFQCNIGVSSSAYQEGEAVWRHLLGIGEKTPGWSELKAALQGRIGGEELADFVEVDEVTAVRFEPSAQEQLIISRPEVVSLLPSAWQITSYSALAHGEKVRIGDKADDESTKSEEPGAAIDETGLVEDDKKWLGNPRYTLKGSAMTGNCLHDIFENHALEPAGDFSEVVERQLHHYGLGKPRRDRGMSPGDYQQSCERYLAGIKNWLFKALRQPLGHEASADFPSLLDLFASRQVIPEMEFDFAIGSEFCVPTVESLNQVLAEAGLGGLGSHADQIHGMMTGAIDLVFIHEHKVYVLDYKSNTLGKSPRFYSQAPMTECMQERRYDLQYMIYSTAVHRFFSRYYSAQYAFDATPGKQLSFGGVFYVFLRGMGLDEEQYSSNGIWFTRPEFEHIERLDKAFAGSTGGDEQ